MSQWKDDLNYGLAAFGIQIPASFDFDAWMRNTLTPRPATSAAVVVIAGGLLMHHFEREHNPKMRTVSDALLYCATSLNVGFAETHPVTRAGKLLSTVLHTYGPALAARTLGEPGAAATADVQSTLRALVAKLEEASKTL